MSYLLLIRPAQWIKNVFVLAAICFGRKLGDPQAIQMISIAFVAFCLASSAGYIFNDILDRERDRLHPNKKDRPLPSGAVSVRAAAVLAGLLTLAAFAVCYPLRNTYFPLTIAAYLLLVFLYSVVLKHRMLLDVITIAVLFVLRAMGGAVAIEVEVSPWLMICTFMLTLFLGFGKRRCEIAVIGHNDNLRGHRQTLPRYTPQLLTHMLSTCGGIAVITFLLYTLDTTVSSPFGLHKQHLLFTLPLVIYGVFRYAMLIELGKGTGPTDLLLNDRPLLATILLWAAASVGILYGTSILSWLHA
ncbi:MAG: decaprenyl-phosphate phosphoribosyltransferase [Phycisphaerales bacterium]|nr:decaprenyl-phosphate phosphoribosyltransferase [Phycisphaerales bacterium]